MIIIADGIFLRKKEIKFKFIRSSGPGGQNVNKVSTAVQLRFDINGNQTLSERVKIRMKKLSGKKVTNDGILIIEAKRFRDQEKNRKDSLDRLIKLIRKALVEPVNRIATKKTRGSQISRLKSKKKHSETKKGRQKITSWDD